MTRLLPFVALALMAASCSSDPVGPGDDPTPPDPPDPEPPSLVELRGVWLTNVDSDVMFSREGIAEAMQFLADHNFNVVYPVVLNAAMTAYPSPTMEAVTGVRIDPRYAGRDPLQEIIDEAARHDIAVIPWFEYGFASSFSLNGGPILAAKPEWAAKDRDGNLLTKNGFEWMNAYHPEVQQFILDLVLEVAENYDVAGIQGDDRLPANPSEGGYSEFTQELYRAEHGGQDPPRGWLDPDWLRWRADKLNAFGRRMYDEVKAVDPDLQVSLSPSIYPWGYRNYLQDWPSWADGGYADQIHPQNYRYDLEAYKATLATQRAAVLNIRPGADSLVYPGVLMNVGDYVIPVDYLMGLMQYNRDQGYRGEVFFFYEGLRKNDDALADTLLSTFYAEPARPPFGD
ncbi:glycoside hydrolase family 10 protein [Rubrivirga sp.]|uniref:glycoside hydrolase family 10 protein n=1 Tax=Rubrivirga sp. TaxID=1885344 RepID=UPI003C753F97